MNSPIGLLASAWLHGHQAIAEMSSLAPDARIALGVASLGTPFLDAARDAADVLGEDLVARTAALHPAMTSFVEHTRPSAWGEAVLKVHLLLGAGEDLRSLTAQHWDEPARDMASRQPGAELGAAVEQTLHDLVKDANTQGRLGLFGRRLIGEATAQAQRVAAHDSALIGALLGDGQGDQDELARASQLIADLVEGAAQRMMALGLQP